MVAETGLTRQAICTILRDIEKPVFGQFKDNPEEFIIKASAIINEQKATAIIQHITYDKYYHIIYDSTNEKNFAERVDASNEVAVYVKLPRGFYISTPVGKYNPDWAIAFHEGKVKHIYFVAETKGTMSSMELRKIEAAKVHCAEEHFKAISSDSVKYGVIDSFEELMQEVMK